jgi:hypothetical protein
MTVKSSPKSARLVPTVGQMGSTKVLRVVECSKVKQVNQINHPKPQTAMNHERILSIHKCLQHIHEIHKCTDQIHS